MPNARPDRHRTKPGCSPDATRFSALPFSLRRRRKGWCLGSSCGFPVVLRLPFLSHIFSMAGSKRSGEGDESRARVLGAFIGAQRRPLTRLPRSVHSSAKKWGDFSRCFLFNTFTRARRRVYRQSPQVRISLLSRLFSSGSPPRTWKPPIFRASPPQPADPTRVNAR